MEWNHNSELKGGSEVGRNLTVFVIFVVLALAISAGAADVAVLKSDMNRNWYYSLGWDFDSEYANILNTVNTMELAYAELSDDDLAAGNIEGAKLLILVNNRMMSVAQVEAVNTFVASGGKVFGLYQSSFRSDTNANVNPDNQYQLDTLYNVGYTGWSGSPPMHAYIKGDTSHAIWQGLPEFVATNRYTSMVNHVLPGGQIVGEWYNSDKLMKSQADLLNAAIVVSDNAVYVAESLFDAIVYQDTSARLLAQNIITYLLQ